MEAKLIKGFVPRFLLFFLFFSILANINFIEDAFISLFLIIAKFFLLFFNPATWTAIGNQITINGNHLIMIKECTGLPIFALFMSFAFAYERNLKNNYLRVLKGIGILFMLNMIRMFTLMLAAYHSEAILDMVHDFLWPATYFLFTLLVVQLYIRGAEN